MPKKKFDSKKYPIQFEYALHLGNMKRVAQQPSSFTGRTANTDRAVMLALIDWALDHRAYTIHPGVRNIASEVGKAPATVSKANRRLQQKGWIKIIYKPGTFDANAQQISLQWNQEKFRKSKFEDFPMNFLLSQKDIWSGDGLGSNAKLVFTVLLEYPDGKRLYELAKLTNLSVKQNQTALSKLIAANLIMKDGRVYRNIAPSDEPGQRNAVQVVRLNWSIDDKENQRKRRFHAERHLRAKTLSSPQVRKVQLEKYKNKRSIPQAD